MAGFTLRPYRSTGSYDLSRPDEAFWTAWRASKDSLKALGISVMKDPTTSSWVVKRYHPDRPPVPVTLPNGYELSNPAGLLPYQVAPAGELCAYLIKNGRSIDCSDAGTGKTYVALAAARELGLRVAVVCPMVVTREWFELAKSYGVPVVFVANWEAVRGKKFPYGSFGADREYVFKNLPSDTLIIFDEAHRAKGDGTANSKLVIGACRQNLKVLLLTATLASNPSEMRASGFALGLHRLFDFNEWRKGLGCYQNKFNGWECQDGRSAMAEVSKHLFPGRGVRVRIEDLGDAFPETQITAKAYPVEDPDAQNEAHAALMAEIDRLSHLAKSVRSLEAKAADALEAWQKQPGDHNLAALDEYNRLLKEARSARSAVMVKNLRYRQEAELRKVPVLVELAKDAIASGRSVAVFVNYDETLQQISKALACPVVKGNQAEEERNAARDAFQSGKTDSLVCNIQAGGVALSLHDLDGSRPREALIAPTYSAQDLKQVLGRVHRAGGKSKSLQRIVYAAGTVEEQVCRDVAGKLASMAALNDGDLGALATWLEEENDGEDSAGADGEGLPGSSVRGAEGGDLGSVSLGGDERGSV